MGIAHRRLKEGDVKRIGFIGIGIMGRRMARRILDGGYPLTVWNRNRDKTEQLVAAGAVWADSPCDVALDSDVVITMVTDGAASESVICGRNGVLAGTHPGLCLVDMSSIDPPVSRRIARRAAEYGVSMLDAPVTGAPHVAEAGSLGIMVGGSRSLLDELKPIFDLMAARIVHVGDNGQGVTLKLLNNAIMAVAVQGVAEVLTLARKCDIDPEKVFDITQLGGAKTAAMDVRGRRMIDRDFDPGFSIDNMHKDITATMRLATEAKASIPATGAALEILRSARTRGLGDQDGAAICAVLEMLAGFELEEELPWITDRPDNVIG